jgi:hypothetical protein
VTDLSGVKKFQNGWTREQEQLMAEWSDIAACYRWLHDRTEKLFSSKNTWITIPVIILSTLTGTANFALGSFISAEPQKTYAQAGIGAVSIFAGILSTLGNFFKFAQNSEANRVASIAWGKFQRLLAVELAINPDDRIEAMDFLKICRNDLDRLIEQSPPVPDIVIKAFEEEFKDMPHLKRPDICHGLDHTHVFDSTKVRINHVTADAALFLKARKKLLRDDILPDLEAIIAKRIEMRVAETSVGNKTEWRTQLIERGRSRDRLVNSIAQKAAALAPKDPVAPKDALAPKAAALEPKAAPLAPTRPAPQRPAPVPGSTETVIEMAS